MQDWNGNILISMDETQLSVNKLNLLIQIIENGLFEMFPAVWTLVDDNKVVMSRFGLGS